VKLLLAHNGDCNAKTKDDSATPLFMAVGQGHRDVVSALLVSKADPNIVTSDKEGGSPIYLAAQEGFLDVVRCSSLCVQNQGLLLQLKV
jgi:ankyrin repeat protein